MFPRLSLALIGLMSSCLVSTSVALAQNPNADGFGEIVEVETGRMNSNIVLGGTVVPARQVTISAQMPGRVEYIAGLEGDHFDKDKVLIALDDDELLAQRRSAMAQMGNADTSLRNAGVQFTRELVNPQTDKPMSGMAVPSMFDSMFTKGMGDMMGINSPGMDRHADLYARSSGVEQARNAYTQARSRLDEIDAKLRDTVGKAPFNGVITNKLVEIGDTVQPGTPLLRYADIDKLQVQVSVPARLMHGLREGDLLTAKLDVRDAPVQVKVAQIFPMADEMRHTITVKLDLPPSAPAGPGMYAEVFVPDRESDTRGLPVIPATALIQRGSLPAVFVVRSDNSRELRVVRTGEQVEPGYISILSGLHGGERIINNPRPGMSTTPRQVKP